MNKKSVLLSNLIIGAMLVSVGFITFGGFISKGNSVYGQNNTYFYENNSYFDELSQSVTTQKVNLTGGTIQEGDATGNYWDSTLKVLVDIVNGNLLDHILDIVKFSINSIGINIPDYIILILPIIFTALFLFAGIGALSGRSI